MKWLPCFNQSMCKYTCTYIAINNISEHTCSVHIFSSCASCRTVARRESRVSRNPNFPWSNSSAANRVREYVINGCNQYDFKPITDKSVSRSRSCKHSVCYDFWEFGQCPKQGDRAPTHGVPVFGVSCKQRVLDSTGHFGQIRVKWTIGAHLSNCPCNRNKYVLLYKFCKSKFMRL